MKKIRIGNTVALSWEIFIHDGDEILPYDLTGKAISVYLINAFATVKIEDFITEDNVLSFTWEGSEQRFAGVYQLTLVENENTDTMLTFDECEAFELVRCSCSDDEDEDTIEKVELSSKLNMVRVYPIVPVIGPNSNWWVDGVDTGKPSTGMSAYEFAKENGYTGTEEEYAAECAAVPTLNEESREAADNADRAAGEARRSATVANSASATATNAALAANRAAKAANDAAEAANTAAELSKDQIEAVGQYIGNEVTPAAEAAIQAATRAINAAEAANNAAGSINGATDKANSAAEAANAAATRAERAIEEFGPAIANKADLENGKIIASQLPDYILGQVMFGGLIYSNGTITASSNFISKYGNDTNISASEASKYNGVYFIVTGEAVNVTIAGVSQVSTGDWIISVGDSWKKIDNSDAVTSVAGLVGNVNASALASVLADITDSNSLARKTDLPKKLSELENDIEIGGGGGSCDDSEIKEILSNIVDEEGYLYSNGEKVDMRFTRSLLPVGTSIPASANLNTIEFLKIGKYYCSLNADAKTIKNCPVNMAFSMEVFNPLGTNVDDETTADYTYRLRVLTPYDTGIHYTQCCRTSGTPGTWTYDSWYVTPRSKFALASSKNDGSAAIGATNKGVYIDSNGEIKAMSYTVAKSVPSNAVFTDTNTKVTAVGNHYAPAEDESQQIDAPSGEVVTGIKRDAAGHVVGVVSTPQTGGEYEPEVYGDTYVITEIDGPQVWLTTNVAENLDEVSARGQLADAYDIKTFVENAVQGGGGGGITTETDPIFSASPAASITEAKKTEWDAKQEKITDLDAIRSGAEKGATALQSVPSEYVTETELMWTKAEGEAGVRLKGTNGTATGNMAISAGDDKTASDGTPFASAASGDHAVAFGYGNTCAGRTTLAQGLYNTVNGNDSVAFGQRNIVNGTQAFAVGQQNEATARMAVAIGYKNKATYANSTAIGYQNTASGSGSVALGDTCESNGTCSTAMGNMTKATGDYSSTFGQNTQATNDGEVAMGLYNKSTTSTDASEQTLFSFGIGTSDTDRANAFEIKKNGDVYIGAKKLSTDNVYHTDFTVEDLYALLNGETDQLQFDGQGLMDALYDHKNIIVPYSNDNIIGGEAILLGEVFDTDINFAVYTHNAYIYYCEAIEGVIYNWGIRGKDATSTVQQTELETLKNVAIANAVQTDGLIYAFPDQATGEEDDVLMSRGTVKTINGQTIMRDGDSDDIKVVYPIVTTNSPAAVLQPNTITKWSLPITLELILNFAGTQDQGYAAEYIAVFTVGSDGVQLIVPSNVVWADGVLPAMTKGKTYEISFVDNRATFLEF